MKMSKKPVRDNRYYLDLLEREYPVTFGEYQAGKHPTVEKALIAAGVKVKRTRLQEMLNAWKKASTAERDAFRIAIGCAATPPAAAVSVTAPSGLFAINRHLQPGAVALIRDIMARRSMKMGDLMRELGRNPRNPSVGLAMGQAARMQQDLIDDLEAWVAKQ